MILPVKCEKALIYSCKMERPEIEDCDFDPKFKNALYFVYLNEKKIAAKRLKNL